MSKQLSVPVEVGVSCERTHVLVHLGIKQNKNLLLPSINFTLQNVQVKKMSNHGQAGALYRIQQELERIVPSAHPQPLFMMLMFMGTTCVLDGM